MSVLQWEKFAARHICAKPFGRPAGHELVGSSLVGDRERRVLSREIDIAICMHGNLISSGRALAM